MPIGTLKDPPLFKQLKELGIRVRDIEQWRELREPAQTLTLPGVRDILQAIAHLQTNVIKATDERDRQYRVLCETVNQIQHSLLRAEFPPVSRKPKASKRAKRVKRGSK